MPLNPEQAPIFSRSIFGGKKQSKLEARVSDELAELVRRRWVDLGFQSQSEYLEYVVAVDVVGPEHIRMVTDRRLSMVCKTSDSFPTMQVPA